MCLHPEHINSAIDWLHGFRNKDADYFHPLTPYLGVVSTNSIDFLLNIGTFLGAHMMSLTNFIK